jgi:hypothetical protein
VEGSTDIDLFVDEPDAAGTLGADGQMQPVSLQEARAEIREVRRRLVLVVPRDAALAVARTRALRVAVEVAERAKLRAAPNRALTRRHLVGLGTEETRIAVVEVLTSIPIAAVRRT